MEQRLSIVTLGVADVARSRAFYEGGLGWRVSPASNARIVFIQLGGMALALYPSAALSEDAHVEGGDAPAFRGFTLAYNARGEAEVDAVLAQAVAAGARLAKPAARAFWGGYSGYFADPDGILWEVAHNPFVTIEPDGRLTLP
ncbi:VOC family protein [Salinarimonas sp.]|uniref:VOC family protein n=1 Tax=Salinarimonas sp. TaxID=2766526 RepID=UPI0032D96C1E